MESTHLTFSFYEPSVDGVTQALPNEVIMLVGQYFDRKTLVNASLTCKTWRQIFQDSTFLKNFFANHFEIHDIAQYIASKDDLKQFYENQEFCEQIEFKTNLFMQWWYLNKYKEAQVKIQKFLSSPDKQERAWRVIFGNRFVDKFEDFASIPKDEFNFMVSGRPKPVIASSNLTTQWATYYSSEKHPLIKGVTTDKRYFLAILFHANKQNYEGFAACVFKKCHKKFHFNFSNKSVIGYTGYQLMTRESEDEIISKIKTLVTGAPITASYQEGELTLTLGKAPGH